MMEGATKCRKCGEWKDNRQILTIEVYKPISWAHTFYEICRDCYDGLSKLMIQYVEGE